nr:protein FAM110C [Cavia porcellus]
MRALPAPSAPRDPERLSAVERLAADRAHFCRRPAGVGDPASRGRGAGHDGDPSSEPRSTGPAAQVPRRATIPRRQPRPDSLVIYRQKCDFARSLGSEGPRGSLVKKLLPGPGRDRTKPALPATSRPERVARTEPASGTSETPDGSEPAAAAASLGSPRSPRVPVAATSSAPPGTRARTSSPRTVRRAGLQRSHSDLSRRSCDPGAEFDAFFRFCGLDPEVVEALGRENFSAGSDSAALKVRSVSVATSEGGFSRPSGGEDDGLQEEALTEQVPSTTSVIERNARIIKWLYTCRKAAETPDQGLQGPA